MLFYTINNLLILVWAAVFCFHKPSKLKNFLFVLFAFTQLIIISALRYQIGYDYNMYSNGFLFMRNDGFEVMSYKDWEIGFVFLTKVLALILPNNLFYMGFFSVITLIPAAIFIYHNSEIPWISTVIYVNTFLFFMTMNFVRQSVALSLVMLAWHFMKRNKFLPFIIIIIIASLFHQTVLIMIPIYFMIKMKVGIKQIILYSFVLLWFYISSTGFIQIITSFFHEEYSGSIFVTSGISYIYTLLPIIIILIALFLSHTSTINLTTENKYLINLTIITAMFSITSSKHALIERLSFYTLIFMVLLVPVIYRSVKQNGFTINIFSKTISVTTTEQKSIVAVIILIFILALSYFNLYYGLSENAHGVVPYNTWANQ